MFNPKQIFTVIFAAVVSIGSAVLAFGQTSLVQASGQKMSTELSTAHGTHSSGHRHHRRTTSTKRKKRVPNAKSLNTESW